jgi:HNH endonuclease/NUMOD4 motif
MNELLEYWLPDALWDSRTSYDPYCNISTPHEANLPGERWMPCPGFENYYSVSNCGRIRRDRPGRGKCRSGRILLGHPSPNGYLVIRLHGDRGVQSWHTVHSLVMTAFRGPRPEGYEINHKDGNKNNNRLSNLKYVTPKKNHEHAAKMGLTAGGDRHWTRKHPEMRLRGTKNPRARLTEQDVREIRRRHAAGDSYSLLALEFDTPQSNVAQIVKRRTWVHVA